MPRVDALQPSFSAGEISPRLLGRPDIAKYNDALKLARDVVVLQTGGAIGRPGSDYLGEVKDSSKLTRLIPFVYSADDAYMLEAGDGYMRVWRQGALVLSASVPYEIATPYSTDEVQALDYTQGADTMLIALATKMIRRLRRFAHDRWALDEAPINPIPFTVIGFRGSATITLSSAAVGARDATASGATFLAGDVGRTLTYRGGVATITAVGSATDADVTVTTAFGGTSLPSGQWLITGTPQAIVDVPTDAQDLPLGASIALIFHVPSLRATDAGSHMQINGGLVRIDTVTDSENATGTVLVKLTGDADADPDSWTLEQPVWNAVDGYPRTVTLHQQRLVAAGSPGYPQTVWGSRSGLYFDFTKGVLDDDSYSYDLSSDEINPIRFLTSNRDLVALTSRGEWTMNGGIEKPITPTNIRAVPQENVGCADTRPEQVGDDLLYVQRGASALRTVQWSLQLGGYVFDEVSTFSEHLFRSGISGITWQQSPERVVWMHRPDGSYVALTVARNQEVVGFTLSTPGGGGVVESMATIPEGGEDRTYMIVRRTINGATKRYVERMNWAAYQDCRVTRSPGSATVTGLQHLAGLTVSAVADGVDMGDFTVTAGGQITLPRSAAVCTVGPRFTPKIKLLPSETGTGMGASAGRDRRVSDVRVLFKDTIGASMNGQPIAFRQFGEDVLDQPVAPFSGWKEASEYGWSHDADEIVIEQPQSYPFCVLAVARRITANPG